MSCPRCGFENRDDASFCGECGASLSPEPPCPRCQRGLRDAQRLYTEIGASGHAERLAQELGS